MYFNEGWKQIRLICAGEFLASCSRNALWGEAAIIRTWGMYDYVYYSTAYTGITVMHVPGPCHPCIICCDPRSYIDVDIRSIGHHHTFCIDACRLPPQLNTMYQVCHPHSAFCIDARLPNRSVFNRGGKRQAATALYKTRNGNMA